MAATHQLLTQILLHLMYAVRHYEGATSPSLGGADFDKEEVRELETLDRDSLKTIEGLVLGKLDAASRSAHDELIRQGRRWAQHILEGPISWIFAGLYVLVTMMLGATPLSAFVYAMDSVLATSPTNSTSTCDPFPPTRVNSLIGFVDGLLYVFAPWLSTVLLRLVQRRPLLHRVGTRSLLIGDIPWVAQSLEAFVSKLFALSYSIASIHVASANPADHLLHRYTHRVFEAAFSPLAGPMGV